MPPRRRIARQCRTPAPPPRRLWQERRLEPRSALTRPHRTGRNVHSAVWSAINFAATLVPQPWGHGTTLAAQLVSMCSARSTSRRRIPQPSVHETRRQAHVSLCMRCCAAASVVPQPFAHLTGRCLRASTARAACDSGGALHAAAWRTCIVPGCAPPARMRAVRHLHRMPRAFAGAAAMMRHVRGRTAAIGARHHAVGALLRHVLLELFHSHLPSIAPVFRGARRGTAARERAPSGHTHSHTAPSAARSRS